MWTPPSREQQDREDAALDRDDRRIARLAAHEIAKYAGLDPHTAWLCAVRLKALRRRGVTDEQILQRLHP